MELLRSGRQASAEETRRKLLEAALHQFSARPYAEVTVSDVARTAGVAHGLVSHHFGHKQGLYLEVLRETNRRIRETYRTDPEAAVGEQVRQLYRAHLTYLAEHDELAGLLLPGTDASLQVGEEFDAVRTACAREVWLLLGLPLERPGSAMVLASFARAADELTFRWLGVCGRPEIDVIVEVLVDLLTGALHAVRTLDPGIDVPSL
ncbi:TetR/AcrR family transcriptional regulator [Streptomyces sp. NPDC051217]|uniref:TetR/AcrR family transcriptional regulator n=1 Tax=Streptomyces sp. NPDC051217 TaxID=3365644 RepID=UPI0037B2BD46